MFEDEDASYNEFFEDGDDIMDGGYMEQQMYEEYLNAAADGRRFELREHLSFSEQYQRCIQQLMLVRGENGMTTFVQLGLLLGSCFVVLFTSCLTFLPRYVVPWTSIMFGSYVVYKYFGHNLVVLYFVLGFTAAIYVFMYVLHHILRKNGLGWRVGGLCFSVILLLQYVTPMKTFMHVRGILMIITMKAFSLGSDIDRDLVPSLPNVVDFSSYCVGVHSIMFGPWIPFREHSLIMKRKEFRSIGKTIWQGLCTFMIAVLCLIMSSCFVEWIIPDHLEHLSPWVTAFRDAMSFRYSHYFVSYTAEGCLYISGYFARPIEEDEDDRDGDEDENDHNATPKRRRGRGDDGNDDGRFRIGRNITRALGEADEEYPVTNPLYIELPRSLVDVVVNWNIPMHAWLKKYVYAPMRSDVGHFWSVLITFGVSSLLHGFNFQISAVLFSLGIYTYAEHVLREKLSAAFDACIRSRHCRRGCGHKHDSWNLYVMLVNFSFFILAVFHLAYLGMVFDSSDTQEEGYNVIHTLRKWYRLNFASHYVALGTLVFAKMIGGDAVEEAAAGINDGSSSTTTIHEESIPDETNQQNSVGEISTDINVTHESIDTEPRTSLAAIVDNSETINIDGDKSQEETKPSVDNHDQNGGASTIAENNGARELEHKEIVSNESKETGDGESTHQKLDNSEIKNAVGSSSSSQSKRKFRVTGLHYPSDDISHPDIVATMMASQSFHLWFEREQHKGQLRKKGGISFLFDDESSAREAYFSIKDLVLNGVKLKFYVPKSFDDYLAQQQAAQAQQERSEAEEIAKLEKDPELHNKIYVDQLLPSVGDDLIYVIFGKENLIKVDVQVDKRKSDGSKCAILTFHDRDMAGQAKTEYDGFTVDDGEISRPMRIMLYVEYLHKLEADRQRKLREAQIQSKSYYPTNAIENENAAPRRSTYEQKGKAGNLWSAQIVENRGGEPVEIVRAKDHQHRGQSEFDQAGKQHAGPSGDMGHQTFENVVAYNEATESAAMTTMTNQPDADASAPPPPPPVKQEEKHEDESMDQDNQPQQQHQQRPPSRADGEMNAHELSVLIEATMVRGRINWAELNTLEEMWALVHNASKDAAWQPEYTLKEAMAVVLDRAYRGVEADWQREHVAALIRIWKKELETDSRSQIRKQLQLSEPTESGALESSAAAAVTSVSNKNGGTVVDSSATPAPGAVYTPPPSEARGRRKNKAKKAALMQMMGVGALLADVKKDNEERVQETSAKPSSSTKGKKAERKRKHSASESGEASTTTEEEEGEETSDWEEGTVSSSDLRRNQQLLQQQQRGKPNEKRVPLSKLQNRKKAQMEPKSTEVVAAATKSTPSMPNAEQMASLFSTMMAGAGGGATNVQQQWMAQMLPQMPQMMPMMLQMMPMVAQMMQAQRMMAAATASANQAQQQQQAQQQVMQMFQQMMGSAAASTSSTSSPSTQAGQSSHTHQQSHPPPSSSHPMANWMAGQQQQQHRPGLPQHPPQSQAYYGRNQQPPPPPPTGRPYGPPPGPQYGGRSDMYSSLPGNYPSR